MDLHVLFFVIFLLFFLLLFLRSIFRRGLETGDFILSLKWCLRGLFSGLRTNRLMRRDLLSAFIHVSHCLMHLLLLQELLPIHQPNSLSHFPFQILLLAVFILTLDQRKVITFWIKWFYRAWDRFLLRGRPLLRIIS